LSKGAGENEDAGASWNRSLLDQTTDQSSDEGGIATYTLALWNICGDSKIVTKAVKIIDDTKDDENEITT
jgi:hypothetical protein